MKDEGGRLKKELRVAVFGAGKMAMHHIKAIRLLKNSRIVAVADPAADPEKLKTALPENVPIFSTPEELLEKARPDIVHICTPPHTHGDLAKLALKNDANVYLEKPFTLRSREAWEVISLARERRRKVCAGHQLLFESHMSQVKEQIEKIGEIVHVESYFSFKPVRRSMDGRTSMPPIDQLIDILPHPVYLLQYFLKRNHREDVPIEIKGMHVRTDGNVHAVLSCGDTTGILVVSLTGRPIESYVKVIGTNGSVCAEFVRGTFVTNPGPGVSGISKVIFPYSQAWQSATRTTKALYRRLRKKQKSYPGLLELIGAFYDSLNPGIEDVLGASSIVETVAVCEEVGDRLRSLEENESRSAETEFRRKEKEVPSPDAEKGKILVTGGTGMLGRAVAADLRKNGYAVLTISRKNQPFSARIPGVEYLKGDLGSGIPEGCLLGVSTVVHCAAETAGGKEAHERNSLGATRNLLQAMASNGVKRLVHI
ncbi:MAG: Gfo/Idh/MocA family oxidoreductase, partial [Deltaproteobacteria bacterium]|nr:Gfo/Idh/MocA family oxidoreductase [Deltaproteobacteria bacterium]